MYEFNAKKNYEHLAVLLINIYPQCVYSKKGKLSELLADNYSRREICLYGGLLHHLIPLCNGAPEHSSLNRMSLPPSQ